MSYITTGRIFGLLGVALLAACSSNPDPGPCIGMPEVPSLELIYPENGATRVPDSVTDIVVATQAASQSMVVTLIPTASAPAATLTAAPSPLPSPHANPPTPPPGATGTPLPWNDYAEHVGALRSGTTYTVDYTFVFSTSPSYGPCPNRVTMSIGSFTTQ